MQGLEQILGSSGTDLAAIGARFGLSPDQTRAAMGSLMPAVAGGFQRRGDAGGLGSVPAVADPADTGVGNEILGHIFGGKSVSREVADHAAGQTGLSSTVLKAMLPVVAAMVAKHVAGQPGGGTSGGGGLGGLLGGLAGGGGDPLGAILGRLR